MMLRTRVIPGRVVCKCCSFSSLSASPSSSSSSSSSSNVSTLQHTASTAAKEPTWLSEHSTRLTQLLTQMRRAQSDQQKTGAVWQPSSKLSRAELLALDASAAEAGAANDAVERAAMLRWSG